MLDLSVVIIACNEERIIGQTLAAASQIAAEIILVDSGSTDNTLAIAKKYGAQCYHQQWLGYAAQKNYALSLASKSWILSLDADEVLSDHLVKEIFTLLSCEPPSLPSSLLDGYLLPRLLYIGQTPLKHGGYYPDAQLRLFKNGKGSFAQRLVHESVQVEGTIGKLKSPLLHYGYIDFKHYADTLERYARLAAQERQSKKAVGLYFLDKTFHPMWTFFYRYIMRAGFLDGAAGLKANFLYKEYVQKKIVYTHELASSKANGK